MIFKNDLIDEKTASQYERLAVFMPGSALTVYDLMLDKKMTNRYNNCRLCRPDMTEEKEKGTKRK